MVLGTQFGEWREARLTRQFEGRGRECSSMMCNRVL